MQLALYQKYKTELVQCLHDLKDLRELINHQDRSFYEGLQSDVRENLTQLERDIDRLDADEFKVALVGAFSAGKSSLLNALYGQYIVPESTEVTTAVPTYIRSTDGEARAEAYYLTKQDINELEDLFREEIAKAYGQPDLASAPITKIQEIFEKKPKVGKSKVLKEHFDIFLEDRDQHQQYEKGRINPLSLAEAQELVKNERKAMFLDKVVIHLPIDIPSDVVLVDLPGVSVPNPRHRRLTFKFIESEAHAVVFVLSATRLFDSDESELLELLRQGDSMMKEKTFWAINRWDVLTPSQQDSTIEQFKKVLKDYSINNEVEIYRTNALHGLLSQIALSGKEPNDEKLKEHFRHYKKYCDLHFNSSHTKALNESGVHHLKDDLFDFINNRIRKTTISSIVQNTNDLFIAPLMYHLNDIKKRDDTYLQRGYEEEVQTTLRERVKKDVNATIETLGKLLKEVREKVVSERKTLFLGKAEELEKKLEEIIRKGDETDAYCAYQTIVGGTKYRKYPYYFEIEIFIIDRLNELLKSNFTNIIEDHARQTYQDLMSKIKDFIQEISKSVRYDPEIINTLHDPMNQLEHNLLQKARGTVDEKATLLDELLVYKPKNLLGFGGNRIIDGLEAAAQLGTEQIKKTTESLKPVHLEAKTEKIRKTLESYYISEVVNFREEIADSFWIHIRNTLVDMEQELLEILHGIYKTRLESIKHFDVKDDFDKKQKVTSARTRRFREAIDVLENVKNRMDSVA